MNSSLEALNKESGPCKVSILRSLTMIMVLSQMEKKKVRLSLLSPEQEDCRDAPNILVTYSVFESFFTATRKVLCGYKRK